MLKCISRVKNYFFLVSNENLKIIHFKKQFHVDYPLSSSRISIRENPAIMKIDTPQFHSVFTPELDSLAKLFEKYGYELRIVGGAVRDLLNGETPHDLDFATTATPDQMKEMFEKEGIRMLNTKGEKHGTITPRINDKANFEVTTLRTDVKTDGRHAEVEFTKNWQLDALRRDLTINSMYLGFDGTVYDYFGGYEDLKNKRILFVGDASKRIQEDYLRILRYFRFYGRIADNPDSHDEETLKAIQQNASGLEKISGERIWSELKRIVIGNFAAELMKKMLDVGLSPYIGLGPPEELDIKCFENTCRLKDKYSLKNITYIAALLPSEEKVLEFHARCKLSAHERDLALFISNFKYDDLTEPIENPLRRFQLIIVTTKMKKEQIREFTLELFRFKDREDLLTSFESWTMPRFPVNGNQMKEKGITGKQMGFVLHKMKELWVESDFKLTEDELIEKLPEIVDELKILQSRKRKM